jgi:hypothetical protein
MSKVSAKIIHINIALTPYSRMKTSELKKKKTALLASQGFLSLGPLALAFPTHRTGLLELRGAGKWGHL